MREFLGISTPVEAIEAMIAGLRENAKRSDFKIDMDTFGSSKGDICFGCAATCTLEKLSGKRFPPFDLTYQRHKYLRLQVFDLMYFERAIDAFRCGCVRDLFKFFNVTDYPVPKYPDSWWCLETCNWEQQLPRVEAYLQILKDHNACPSDE